MTPVLNNGILMRDTTYKAGSHLDKYHLQAMMGDAQPLDMGVVDLWAMTQKVEMPLYQLSSFNGKNVKHVPGTNRGQWKWTTPISQDVAYVIEDIEPLNLTKGIDGTSFKVKLNKRFAHTEVFTYDQYIGCEIYVLPSEDIIPMGDAYIHTVKLINNDNYKFLDNQFLKGGTKMFSKGTIRSQEYSQRFADMQVEAGSREFYNFISNGVANNSYSVSTVADMRLKGAINADGTIPITEIWKTSDPNIDLGVPRIETMIEKMGAAYVTGAIQKGTLTKSLVRTMEVAHMNKLARDVENYLMWGHGGLISQTDGPDNIRMSVGLWMQLDSAYKRIYNKSNFSLDLFQAEIYNFFNGKVEFNGPDSKRQLIVQTGLGGFKLASEAIARKATAAGFTIQASANGGIGAISGKAMDMNFGFAYTSFDIPFLANVKFVINAAFDNVNANDITNPIIDGFRLSSYSFIIFDVTESGNDNIFLLKDEDNHQMRWWYENGTADYMGKSSGFQSSGKFTGYRCFMEQPHSAIWVKDPTKVLKIVMRNPRTGGSF